MDDSIDLRKSRKTEVLTEAEDIRLRVDRVNTEILRSDVNQSWNSRWIELDLHAVDGTSPSSVVDVEQCGEKGFLGTIQGLHETWVHRIFGTNFKPLAAKAFVKLWFSAPF